jgi:hypothetical protein
MIGFQHGMMIYFMLHARFISPYVHFLAFQQTKIKPVNPVNPVKKQYCKSCQKKQIYNL